MALVRNQMSDVFTLALSVGPSEESSTLTDQLRGSDEKDLTGQKAVYGKGDRGLLIFWVVRLSCG